VPVLLALSTLPGSEIVEGIRLRRAP